MIPIALIRVNAVQSSDISFTRKAIDTINIAKAPTDNTRLEASGTKGRGPSLLRSKPVMIAIDDTNSAVANILLILFLV